VPIQVDPQERLDELAVATLTVVQRDGLAALTIRSVADEVGRSTAVVTNYLPTRAALVLNAFRHGREAWGRELGTAVAGLEGPERLDRTLQWWSSSEPIDGALRQLWLEIVLTSDDPRFAAVVGELSADDRDRVRAAVAAADNEAGDLLVDALLLVLRGFWVSATEDPEQWTPDRGLAAFRAIAAALDAGAQLE
jgi:AcrR family transcriptional regulator